MNARMNRIEPLPEGRCGFIYTVDLRGGGCNMTLDLLSDPKWVYLVKPVEATLVGHVHSFIPVFFFPTLCLGSGF